MKKIYDFSSFSRLYEAEEGKEKPYESLLKQILSYLNTCYMSQLKLTADPYDSKIMGDLDLVANSPGVESYKKILDNVKGSVNKEIPEARDASEAWNASGEKLLSSLGKLIEKLPDAKEGIDKIIVDFVNLQKQNLQKASQENKLKAKETPEPKNESLDHDFDSINESIFKTKKSLYNKLTKEVTVSLALLKNSSSIPGMEDVVKSQQTKIDGIVSKLSGKEVKDMKKEDLEKDLEVLSTIPSEIAKKSGDLAKEDTANKEVAVLFIDAIKSIENATAKDKAFSDKIKADEERDKGEKTKEKERIGFKNTIKKQETKGKNQTLAKVQEEIIKAFKGVIKDSEVFKKFSEGKYAGDGFFGNNTEKVVVGLKRGFGMKDETPDITEELIDNILSYKGGSGKTNESLDHGMRFLSFDSFESILEKKVTFDVKEFKKATGELGKEAPPIKEVKEKIDKMVEETYEKHKEGIDYLMAKEFEPTEEGKKNFRGIFRTSWDAFKDFKEYQKKNVAAMGFRSILEPTLKIDKGIGKDVLDIYLKAESKK
jgi:hypothetical protein